MFLWTFGKLQESVAALEERERKGKGYIFGFAFTTQRICKYEFSKYPGLYR